MRESKGLELAVSGAHKYARTFGSSSCPPFEQSLSLASEQRSSSAAQKQKQRMDTSLGQRAAAAQQRLQPVIDLDADSEIPAVVTAPPTATEMTMVAQQTLLPVATSGRRRSRSPTAQSASRPLPTTERGRGWIRTPGDPITGAARDFYSRHPSFAVSDAAQSIPPAPPKAAATPPRARARNAVTAKDLEVEDRFQQIERRANVVEERLNMMEQRIGVTSLLAEKLDGFAAGVAVHAARLDELAVTHQTAITTLGTVFEAKLEVMEAAFKELQQAAYAAPAASVPSPPGMGDSVGIALLRSRLDDLARDALKTNEKCKELDDCLVTMNVNVREGHAATACQLVQAVDAVREEATQSFTYVAHQLESLEQKIATSACRCPMSCPGVKPQATANLPSAGDGRAGACNAADGARDAPGVGHGPDPLGGGKDAWSRWHRKGGGGGSGGGGGGGGGGPDGGDDDNAEHFEFSDMTQDHPNHGRKPLTKFDKSPFETKAATLELPRFNGKTGREMWRKRVTFYLHSKNPDMLGLLRWAEREREPVSTRTLAAARRAALGAGRRASRPGRFFAGPSPHPRSQPLPA